jgi:hypothetical protein
MRLGYQRAGNPERDTDSVPENRWLLELTARAGLAGDVWLANRLRLDLRDIGGSHSSRYRYRIGVEKEFATASGLPIVPYLHAEWFYDTRYDAWSRVVYQGGSEIELDKRWRIEPYYAFQRDTRPNSQNVNRLGLILKYYH